jgi:hypothetical protein
VSHHATAPPVFQIASVTIAGNNTRATIIAVGGAEFEVNDDGLFTVEVTEAGGRRLNGFFKRLKKKSGFTTPKGFGENLVHTATIVATNFASTVSMDPAPMFANGGQAFVPGPTQTEQVKDEECFQTRETDVGCECQPPRPDWCPVGAAYCTPKCMYKINCQVETVEVPCPK